MILSFTTGMSGYGLYTNTNIHVDTQTHPSCYHIYHNCNQWVPYQTTIQQLNYTFPAILSRDQKSGWQYLGNKDQCWRWAGVRTTRFHKVFDIFKKNLFYFGYGFLVALSQRQKELPELSRFLKTILIFRFWISGLGGDISEIKELPQIC